MTQGEGTLIVIPTYNEAENVDAVLRRVRAVVPEANILVVDDNSPDKTAELAEKLGKDLGRIDVLRREGKAGLGAAYRAGFAWGLDHDFSTMVEMDADLSHNPDDLPRLLDTLEKDEADLVIGSRYVPGGAIPGWPLHRMLLSRMGNIYVRIMLNIPVSDATAGFRAYRSSVLRRLQLDAIRADGYGFQIEMAYRVAQLGGTIREVPVVFVDRVAGDSKMSSRIIFEALALVTRWGIMDRLKTLRQRRHDSK